MWNKSSKTVAVVLVLLLLLQCLPLNALQVFAENMSEESEASQSSPMEHQISPLSTPQGSYEAVKPRYDFDESIQKANVAIITSSNKLAIEGETTFKNGGQVAVSIVDLSGNILNVYVTESKKDGSFKINAIQPDFSPDEYFIHIKGKQLESIKKVKDNKKFTVNVSNISSGGSTAKSLAKSADVVNSVYSSNASYAGSSLMAYTATSSTIEAGVPTLWNAVSNQMISSLPASGYVFSRINATNNSDTSCTTILFMELYDKYDSLVDSTYTIQEIQGYSNIDIETDSIDLPADVNGMYTKVFLVDIDYAPLTPAYVLPVPMPENLDGEITGSLSGDKVTLMWDPVPGAVSYKVLRDGTELPSPTPLPSVTPLYDNIVISKTHIYCYQRLSEVAFFISPPKSRQKIKLFFQKLLTFSNRPKNQNGWIIF